MTHGADAAVHPTRTARTDLLLTLLVLLWGLNFSVAKAALAEFHPLAFNALRFVLACGLLTALERRHARTARPAPIARADWPALVAIGLLGNTLYQVCFILGLDATLAGNSALVLAVTPVFITGFSVAARHERVGALAWAGVAASVAGVALVILGGTRVAFGRDTLRGDLLTLGAAVCWAAYTVLLAPYVRRYGALRMTSVTLLTGGAGLWLVALPAIARQDWTRITIGGWAAAAYSGLGAIGLAYYLWHTGVERIGSTRTAVYSNLIPAVALVAAWRWLGETPGLLQLGGAAAIFAGIALTRLGRVHPGPPPEPLPDQAPRPAG
jgi:drug/metabolite transporter (DMT)-like permease